MTLASFGRFVVVGVLNTLAYYVVYLPLLLTLPYLAAHVVAWTLSLLVSYWLNSMWTFGVRPSWRRLAVYPLSSVPNLVMTSAGVVVLVEWVGLDDRLAPFVAGLLAVPFTYVFTAALLTGGRRTAPRPEPDGDDAEGPGRTQQQS